VFAATWVTNGTAGQRGRLSRRRACGWIPLWWDPPEARAIDPKNDWELVDVCGVNLWKL